MVEKTGIALIVTDGEAETNSMAERIAGELSSCSVVIRNAVDFQGTDLLPADILFLGCAQSEPPSFGYIRDLLGHINLVGRPCGLFSSGQESAINYLANLVKDSEMTVGGTPLYASGLGNLQSWVKALAENIKRHG